MLAKARERVMKQYLALETPSKLLDPDDKNIGIASQSVICSATFVTKPVKAGTPKVLGIIGMTLLQKRRC